MTNGYSVLFRLSKCHRIGYQSHCVNEIGDEAAKGGITGIFILLVFFFIDLCTKRAACFSSYLTVK